MRIDFHFLKPGDTPIDSAEKYHEGWAEYVRVLNRKNEIGARMVALRESGANPGNDLKAAYREARTDEEDARRKFYRRNPRVLVAICPICGQEIWQKPGIWSLNDAWWYQGGRTGREVAGGIACPHFFGSTGALCLNGFEPENTAIHADAPGRSISVSAERPFVIPRVLNLPGMLAVLQHFPVADKHTAFITSYFSENLPIWEEHFVIPPAANYLNGMAIRPGGDIAFTGKRADKFDFDLEKWKESGKLMWVNPDGEAGLLRMNEGEFVYARVQGRENPFRIEGGKVIDLPIPEPTGPQVTYGDL